MTTRVRKVITAIDPAGTAFSEVHTETLVGDRWFSNDPTSLATAGPEAAAWQAQYNAAVSQQLATTQATLATTQATLATAETARDAALLQVAELSGQVSALTEQADTIPGLQARIAELEAEVTRLTALVPPPIGPREITPENFLTRFSQADIVAIDQSKDPRVILAKVTLQTRSSVIDLDSPTLAGLIDGLIEAGIQIDEIERARILA